VRRQGSSSAWGGGALRKAAAGAIKRFRLGPIKEVSPVNAGGGFVYFRGRRGGWDKCTSRGNTVCFFFRGALYRRKRPIKRRTVITVRKAIKFCREKEGSPSPLVGSLFSSKKALRWQGGGKDSSALPKRIGDERNPSPERRFGAGGERGQHLRETSYYSTMATRSGGRALVPRREGFPKHWRRSAMGAALRRGWSWGGEGGGVPYSRRRARLRLLNKSHRLDQ